MAPDEHTRTVREQGQLVLLSPSNALTTKTESLDGLKHALEAFKKVLTSDERRDLDAEQSVPRDSRQVVAFTVGLDRVDPDRRGPSIATKLNSIIQTVLQFSQVVDTYVSSNPAVAALVWGSVRLALGVCPSWSGMYLQ